MGKSDSCAGPPPVFPTVLSKFRQNVEGEGSPRTDLKKNFGTEDRLS